jgi:hypothetical protein
MASRSFHALAVGTALLVGWPPLYVRAQDGRPSGLEITFEWQYSCPNGKGCSFSCPGSGGASNVTKLSMYMGTIPIGATEHSAGVYYEFSSMQIPRGNGFALTTGISRLSCQVSGMNLDYSGSPKKNESPAVENNDSPAVTSSIAH